MNAQQPTHRKLDVAYDYVAIVDFLPNFDRASECTSDALGDLLKSSGYKYGVKEVNNNQEFIGVLRALAKRTHNGENFILQLVGHGTAEGLVMPDTGIVLNWSVVAPALRQFHPDVIEKMILNMSCCKGINGAKIASYLEVPFFGLIGPGKDIPFDIAYEINNGFYKKMMSGVSVNDIIRQLQAELGDDVVYGITSYGYLELRGKQLRGEKLS